MTARLVEFGADRLSAFPRGLRGLRRVGLLTNDAAVLASDASLPSRLALLSAGAPIVRLFSPEHGLRRTGPDGVRVPHSTDERTGLPVFSVYGAHFTPPDDLLADLDLLLIDLPDVGTRCYTYAWSMTHALDACERIGTPVGVLDRPNPLSGSLDRCEGPVLDERCCSSFLGRLRMPLRHSLTLGELARLWCRERTPGVNLQVLRCHGWSRDMDWAATGRPFVAPSPAIPVIESALLYPGIVLFEGTNVGVGRGTSLPFRMLGSEWLRPAALMQHPLVRRHAAGVVLRHRRMETPLGGDVQALVIDVVEPASLRPAALGLALLAAVRELQPREFQWTDYPTAANPSGAGHFERLCGRSEIRLTMERRPVTEADLLTWCDPGDWASRVAPVLLYGDLPES